MTLILAELNTRYIVKVVIVNGIFKTTYPVLYDPVLLWHQYQLQGHAPPNASHPYDFSRCFDEDNWQQAQSECVPVSGVGHKCPISLSRGVPFVCSKWH